MTGPHDEDAAWPSSTLPVEREPAWWETAFHMVAVGSITLVVAAASLGLLGVRSSTVTAADGGYRLEVTAPAIARPGLAAPFSVAVSTTNGVALPSTLTFRIDADYLAIFDENGLDPDPARGFNDGSWIWWSFDMAEGVTTFAADFDARIEPGVQWMSSGSAALEVDGQIVVATDFTTWVMP